MAIVTKFSRANLDFKADILEKYDSDPVDGIRSCRHLLLNCNLTADEKTFVRIVLARCYIKIDANDFALRELKIALANSPNHPDAVLLIVTVLQKLPGTSISAPLEYFQNLYNELGSCDKVDEVFMIACQKMRGSELSFDENDDLFLVPDKDIIDRLKDKTVKLLLKNKFNEAITLLDNADKKYVQGLELRERLTLACQAVGDYKRTILEAEENMKMYDNAFLSIIFLLDTVTEHNIEYDINKLRKYMLNCNLDTPSKFRDALTIAERAGWQDCIPKLLENAKLFSDHMFWRLADAFLDYHNGNNLLAIEKLKTVSALFGIHSCADEYIKIINSGKELVYNCIGELPQDYFLDKVQKFALAKESFTSADVNKIFATEEFKRDLHFVASGGEVKIFEWVMHSLTSATICENMEYFENILLDEDVYSVEIRKIILETILVKASHVKVPYSSTDVVRFTNYKLEDDDMKYGKRIINAYATAYAQASFTTRQFSDSLRASFVNIAEKIKGNLTKYDCISCLAALISLGAYIYFTDNLVDDIIRIFGTRKSVFNKYLKDLNYDGSIYSDNIAEEKFMIQLNEIVKSFGEIEFMSTDSSAEDYSENFEEYSDEEWNEFVNKSDNEEDDEESDGDDDDDK